jgi:predicted transglutaminase-like cysteine proteinase
MRWKLACIVLVLIAQPSKSAIGGVVSDLASDTSRVTTDGPFASTSLRAPEGPLENKWQLALADIYSELAILSDCRARPDRCLSPAATRFLKIVERAAPFAGIAKLAMVNSGINAAIRRDFRQRAEGGDPWPTALATFTAGRGVCMHFSIAKYTALLLGGWPANDMRLVMVWPDGGDLPHMILAARYSGHWHILDNLRSAVLVDSQIRNYVALFTFDHRGASLRIIRSGDER